MKHALLLGIALTGCVTLEENPADTGPDDNDTNLPDDGPGSAFDNETHENPRPADAPDVVILTISGHNSTDNETYNDEYLARSGMPQALANVFLNRGLSAEAYSFADEFYSWEDSSGMPLVFGFLDFLDAMLYVGNEWIADFDNPTRLIIAAHSHGDVWAHTAVNLLPVPVDFLIDFDGESKCWESDFKCASIGDDWSTVIGDWSAANQVEWNFDIRNAADAWYVPGRSAPQDIEELVPESVLYNIEFHANGAVWPIINDDETNLRLDGTNYNIFTYQSAMGHSDVYRPGYDAMNTTEQILQDAYFE